MNFRWENIDKIIELASALNALEKQINEVEGQIAQFPRERLAEILTGRKSELVKFPMRMKRVVLTWLRGYHPRGLTARELFNDRDALEEYSGRKFPRRVEAYSMFLGRLERRYVVRVKQGKEFRYYITMRGFLHLLDLIKLEKIAEKSREMAEESRERAFLVSQRTKITTLQIEQMQVAIDKIPGILDATDGLEIYSRWGKTLLEAAESIRALQISASSPMDQATRESAVKRGEEACDRLLFMITLMFVLVCHLCTSGGYAKNPDGGP